MEASFAGFDLGLNVCGEPLRAVTVNAPSLMDVDCYAFRCVEGDPISGARDQARFRGHPNPSLKEIFFEADTDRGVIPGQKANAFVEWVEVRGETASGAILGARSPVLPTTLIR